MACTIEIHDTAVTAVSADHVLAEVPGFAIVQPGELLIGSEAERNRRTFPRQAVSGFWSRLSMEELPVTGQRARTWADLGYAQLTELWRRVREADADAGPVVLAVPPKFDRQRLAILLGIAQHCPFEVVGLVDQVVAMASVVQSDFPVIVIDVALHHAQVATVHARPDIVCRHLQTYPDCGSLAVQNAWAAHIADQFVRETRYDPLHDGVSEQQLYQHLEGWQAALEEHETVPVELTRNNTAYQVVLDRSALRAADRARWQPLVEQLSVDARILLTERAARTPGLEAAIGEGVSGVLGPLDLARGVERNLDHLVTKTDDGGYILVDSLPRPETAPTATSRIHPPTGDAEANAPRRGTHSALTPTHVLVGNKAWAITDEVLHVGRSGGKGRWAGVTGLPGHLCDLVRTGQRVELRNTHPSGTLVNGVRVDDCHIVAAGDRIVAPETGVELLAIEVEPGVS